MADTVFVHFPGSKVELTNLPPEVIPISAHSWTFPARVALEGGTFDKQRVTRHQMCIQPGFCMTAHGAQGQTMSKTICPLHEGGFAAYVMASRATSRHGLFITQPVTMRDLNKPLPPNLVEEMKYLCVLQNNTMIRHNMQGGNIINPISCDSTVLQSINTNLSISYCESDSKSSKKRKKYQTDNQNTNEPTHLSKRGKTVPLSPSQDVTTAFSC